LLRLRAASIRARAPIGILTAVLPIGRKIDIRARDPEKVADRSPTRFVEKLLKKMSASRGLWLRFAREHGPSGAVNTTKEPDMTTTKQIPRRRIIAATVVAISDRPDVTDGKSHQRRHRCRRFAQLVWRR
jgi:hypothetical protein